MTDAPPPDVGADPASLTTFITRYRGWGCLGLFLVIGMILAFAGFLVFGSPSKDEVTAGATVTATGTAATTPATSGPPSVACAPGLKQDLVVSGAVSGTITCAQAAHCDNVPANHFGAQITGQLNGATASLYIRLDPYRGPGTYDTGKPGLGGAAAEFTAGHDWQTFLITGAAGTGRAVVNSDGRAGSIDTDLLNSNPKAGTGPTGDIHVKGDWHCG